MQRITEVAYKLALPPKLSYVHNVFHVARLRKFELDCFHEINFDDIKLNEDATYIEKLVRIAACEERKLKMKVIPLVKVCGGKVGQKKK